MRKVVIGCIAFILSFSLTGFAQDSAVHQTFDASMQFRPRFEYRDGNFRPLSKGEDPAALVSSRLRLNADYTYSDLLKVKISFQNVGLWGQTGQVQGISQSTNNIGLFEGWVDLKIYKGFRAKIGRQIISLDDERLFGALDWAQGGRSHDALSLYYSSDKFDVKSFFAFNQNYNVVYQGNLNNPSGNLFNTTGAQPYKLMQTLWMDYQFSKESKASFLFTNLGFQNATSNGSARTKSVADLQTTGLNYYLNSHSVQVHLSGYYQFGKDLQHTEVSAYYLSGVITGQITSGFALGLNTEFLSGNRIGQAAETQHAFSTLYGTGHKFNGSMDYFPFQDVGLMDYEITANYNVSSKVSLNAGGHFFFAPSAFERNGVLYHTDLGQELDLDFTYKINSFIGISGGYSVYFTTHNLLGLENISNPKSLQNWAWLSLDVHPGLFKIRF